MRCALRNASLATWLVCAPGLVTPVIAQPANAPQVRIDLPSSQEHYRDRITRAAAESLTQLSLWLGPFPHNALTIRTAMSPPQNAEANGAPARGTIEVRLPWLSAPSTMDVERQVAHAIALLYWPHAADDAPIARGLATYLQSRITERLFNLTYARPGDHADEVGLFGGYVPWAFPTLRLERSEFREHRPEAMAFAALEGYLGWPVLQGALKVLATATPGAALTRDRAVAVISAAAGQDLAWFFKAAFDPAGHVDYALTEIAFAEARERCPAPGCVRTRVTVARRGTTPFGKVPVQVVFTDGQQVTATWDGAAERHTFEFESPSPPLAARLDSDGALLIDPTRLDHVRHVSPGTNAPLLKWMARWLVWLQDTLITYTALL